MVADARVVADAFDDLAAVEIPRQGIAVEFIKEGDAHREVGIGKELDRLGLARAGQQHRHRGVKRGFAQETGKALRGRALAADHDARGMQVVVKRAALAQELGREEKPIACQAGRAGHR